MNGGIGSRPTPLRLTRGMTMLQHKRQANHQHAAVASASRRQMLLTGEAEESEVGGQGERQERM